MASLQIDPMAPRRRSMYLGVCGSRQYDRDDRYSGHLEGGWAFALILKFSVPLLAVVGVAQFASRMNYAVVIFSPTITGLLAGGRAFFIAFAAIGIVPQAVRVVYVSGRKLPAPAQTKRNAAKITGEPQPKKSQRTQVQVCASSPCLRSLA